jgi:hypothetical protein
MAESVSSCTVITSFKIHIIIWLHYRSSFSPPPSETSTFKTYQNVNYDVTQCHTDEIVVFPKYSSQINTLKVAGNSTEDRPSDVLVSVSNGQQVTDNSKPHQENKMEIANANQIVTADMYMPGFQAIKSFLSANLNKYVGLENVSIRFSGERGEVPEYVREDCPVNGILIELFMETTVCVILMIFRNPTHCVNLT